MAATTPAALKHCVVSMIRCTDSTKAPPIVLQAADAPSPAPLMLANGPAGREIQACAQAEGERKTRKLSFVEGKKDNERKPECGDSTAALHCHAPAPGLCSNESQAQISPSHRGRQCNAVSRTHLW